MRQENRCSDIVFFINSVNKTYNDTFELYNDCRAYRYKVQIVERYDFVSNPQC